VSSAVACGRQGEWWAQGARVKLPNILKSVCDGGLPARGSPARGLGQSSLEGQVRRRSAEPLHEFHFFDSTERGSAAALGALPGTTSSAAWETMIGPETTDDIWDRSRVPCASPARTPTKLRSRGRASVRGPMPGRARFSLRYPGREIVWDARQPAWSP